MPRSAAPPSAGSRLLALAMTAGAGNKLGYRDLDEVRRKVERQRVRPAHFGPPRKLQRSCAVSLSFPYGWPCYEITPRARAPRAQVLYLHGGAYIEQVGANHWALVEELTHNLPARVVVPVYPLAPEGTAETVLPGLTDTGRRLAERGAGPGLPTVFMGDSAGGGLAVAVAQRLRDEGEANADRLVLISPWLDAEAGDPLVDEIQPRDPMLAAQPLRWAGALWAGALPPSHPAVSPLHGGMEGLPPSQVFAGTRDILFSDARRFRERAEAAGVLVEMHEEAGQVHAYPLWPVAEGRQAREQILAGVRRAERAG